MDHGGSQFGRAWRSRFSRAVAWVVLGAVGALWGFVALAEAFVYYGDTNNYGVGRAGLAGQAPLDPFRPLGAVSLPCGVAVNGPYVYWGERLYGRIGRARIDGTGALDPSFIVGATEPCGLAVYRHRLYWVNQAPTGSIGRANLRGPLDVHENFVPSEQGSSQGDLEEPCGVAVDSTGIYWTDRVGGAVGHANLDGTGGRTLIAGGYATACGIALSSPYIYFAHSPYTGAGSIARALKSGDRVDPAFITGLNGPCGAALYGHDLYFADGATIDRTDLASPDPTSATAQIILGTKDACGVAVDGLFAGRIRVLAIVPAPAEPNASRSPSRIPGRSASRHSVLPRDASAPSMRPSTALAEQRSSCARSRPQDNSALPAAGTSRASGCNTPRTAASPPSTPSRCPSRHSSTRVLTPNAVEGEANRHERSTQAPRPKLGPHLPLRRRSSAAPPILTDRTSGSSPLRSRAPAPFRRESDHRRDARHPRIRGKLLLAPRCTTPGESRACDGRRERSVDAPTKGQAGRFRRCGVLTVR